jgi:D-alanyl-D-alanine dipeptidase
MISLVKRAPHNLVCLVSLVVLSFACPELRAQSSGTTENSLLPGPKPLDVPIVWKKIVGIYSDGKSQIIVLERSGDLIWREDNKEAPLGSAESGFLLQGPDSLLHSELDSVGNVERIVATPRSLQPKESASTGNSHDQGSKAIVYVRADAGADPSHFYHVRPAPDVPTLRERALKQSPPGEVGPFRKPDLVELATLDPAIHLDIRYASANNFLSTPVYLQARAFMQRPAGEALLRVLHKLQPLGYALLIHDAYRPWYVTKIFWDATPEEGRIFVADPQKGSKHNRGCAVDLTLYDLSSDQPIEMPGLYDEMSPRSFPNFPGGTSLQRWHRDLLRRAMESEGFTVNEDEWWHFDYKDWKLYPILDVPFEKLAVSNKP